MSARGSSPSSSPLVLGPLLLHPAGARPAYPATAAAASLTPTPTLPGGGAAADGADVDSDVLLSDDSDGDSDGEDSSQGDGDGEGDEADFFSQELYTNFIHSVFASPDADDADRHSLCSGTDEDDEEYRPQSVRGGSVGEHDCDEDDEDDVDINTITNRELKQLVDFSWRTVTSHAGDASQDGVAGVNSGGGGAASSSSARPEDPAPTPAPRGHPRDKNLMTALLDKLLAGEEASGICVDGMQVDSLRRLVARQLSMALQVLVEMLLLCENRSVCELECFNYLMELGNHRGG
jgi:hypothetical protein